MNKHMYILADGGRIAASDPSEFVRVLREGSWFDSGCTDGEYMVNFSGRYRELHGMCLTDFMVYAGIIQDTLSCCGFTGINVSHDTDVSCFFK